MLIVTGYAKNIGKDISDSPYMTFESNELIPAVQCMFDDSHKKELARLEKVQKITVSGRCEGKFGNVI
jgi:hypothetical protein